MNNEALNEWMEDNTDINQIQAKVDKAMTPKEKAAELVNWFLNEGLNSFGRYQSTSQEDLEGAKFCATKVVNEILSVIWHMRVIITYNIEYWKEVKQEIESYE